MKHSKRYNNAYAQYDRQKRYDLDEALKLLKSLPATKFDETVEVHFNLGVDPRKADQQIRNSLVLPHGTGKVTRVLVFAEGDKAEEAKKAKAEEKAKKAEEAKAAKEAAKQAKADAKKAKADASAAPAAAASAAKK